MVLDTTPPLRIRPSKEEDAEHLRRWMADPQALRWFPMIDGREVDDAVRIWTMYSKMEVSLSAYWEGELCGIAYLNILPYEKLKHQCLLTIIVAPQQRGKGIGTALLQDLFVLSKKKGITLLHLEVYAGNPAKRLYERQGFVEYGRHPRYIKEGVEYIDKILMQKVLS